MGIWYDLIGTLSNTFRIGKNKALFDASGLTAARTFTLPDSSGTISLGGGGGSDGEGLTLELVTSGGLTPALNYHYLLAYDLLDTGLAVISLPNSGLTAGDRIRFTKVADTQYVWVLDGLDKVIGNVSPYTEAHEYALINLLDSLEIVYDGNKWQPKLNRAAAVGVQPTQASELVEGHVGTATGGEGKAGRARLTLERWTDFTYNELRVQGKTRIRVPAGFTYSMVLDIVAVAADYSVSQWHLIMTVQNTGAGAFSVGKRYSPINSDPGGSTVNFVYGDGFTIPATGPASEISAINIEVSYGGDDGADVVLYIAQPGTLPSDTKIYGHVDITKLYQDPPLDSSSE